jgi:hypothetical protein
MRVAEQQRLQGLAARRRKGRATAGVVVGHGAQPSTSIGRAAAARTPLHIGPLAHETYHPPRQRRAGASASASLPSRPRLVRAVWPSLGGSSGNTYRRAMVAARFQPPAQRSRVGVWRVLLPGDVVVLRLRNNLAGLCAAVWSRRHANSVRAVVGSGCSRRCDNVPVAAHRTGFRAPHFPAHLTSLRARYNMRFGEILYRVSPLCAPSTRLWRWPAGPHPPHDPALCTLPPCPLPAPSLPRVLVGSEFS